MNRSSMRTQIADFCGDRNITRFTETQYNTAIDRAQEQFSYDTRALWKDVSYTTANGDADYDLPSDFTWEDWVTYNGKELVPISRHELQTRYGEDWASVEGEPTHFIIDPEEAVKELLLFPIPQEAKTVVMRYFPLPAALSSDSSVPLNSSALMAPFHLGLCAFAAKLLLMGEDPTPAILQKMAMMDRIYLEATSKANDTFRNTASAPINIRGGRTWSA